ncbi:MAG: hypothetical protein ABIF92_01825, partial [archaeon]
VENNPYLKNLDKTFQAFKEMLQQGQPAKDAAKTYAEAVEDTSNRFRFQTSPQAKMMVAKKLKDTKGYAVLL